MGIFDFLRRKDDGKFTERDQRQEERELGGSITRAKKELNALKLELDKDRLRLEAERDKIKLQTEIEHYQQQLDDLIGEDPEEEGGGGAAPEDALLAAFLGKIMGGQPAAPQIQQPAPAAPLDLEEEQFGQIWRSLSKNHQKVAKGMTDDQLKAIIRGNMPNISDESLDRGVLFVRNQKV